MKHPFNFFVLLIVLFSSCRKHKEVVIPEPEPTKEIINTLVSGSNCVHFERLFKGYKMEDIMAVKQTKDGGYILCGSTETIAANENDILIIKTNCFGETEWMKTISNSYSDFGYDITPLSSGGYFVTANFSLDPNYWKMISHKGQFILLDQDGNMISKEDCNTGTSTIVYNTIETADGNLLICGNDENSGNFILKTDVRGRALWIKYLGNVKLNAISKHNNNYIGCGSVTINNKTAIYLVEMNAAGDTLWTKAIDKNSNQGANSITVLSNNEIAIGGSYRTSNTTFEGFVMRLDATGKEIWYTSLGADGAQSTANIANTTSNDIITVGNKPGYLSIAKLDFNTGSITWTVNKSLDSSIRDFKLCADGGFIIVGNVFQAIGNRDGYVLKTDENGN